MLGFTFRLCPWLWLWHWQGDALRRSDSFARAASRRSGNLAEDTAISVGLARLGLRPFSPMHDRTGDWRPTFKRRFSSPSRWSVIRRPMCRSIRWSRSPARSPRRGRQLSPRSRDIRHLPAFCVTLAGWFCAETAFAAAKDGRFQSGRRSPSSAGKDCVSWRGCAAGPPISSLASHRFDARRGQRQCHFRAARLTSGLASKVCCKFVEGAVNSLLQ